MKLLKLKANWKCLAGLIDGEKQPLLKNTFSSMKTVAVIQK